jgi:hypothetical protein
MPTRKKPPDWLKTNTILEQMPGDDRHKAYRIKSPEVFRRKKQHLGRYQAWVNLWQSGLYIRFEDSLSIGSQRCGVASAQ